MNYGKVNVLHKISAHSQRVCLLRVSSGFLLLLDSFSIGIICMS